MTVTSRAPPRRTPTSFPEPPFPPELVEELVRHSCRARRAHQLYLPNNPVYQRAIDGVRASFVPIWAETWNELVLQISESGVPLDGASR